MTTLAELHRAVQATLTSQRLGTPVFVRYLLQTRDEAPTVPTRLAQLTAVVRGWLNQPLLRVYALGSAQMGHITLSLEFRQGATAALTWARGAVRGLGVDLTVLGNHGTLYHDTGAGLLWDQAAAPLTEAPEPALLALIERALRTSRPEMAEGQP